jgi:cephalosporin-C deacetylase
MAYTDLPLDVLRDYRLDDPGPADFDQFWQRSLDETADHDLDVVVNEIDGRLMSERTYDLTFHGFGGDRVAAWLHLPRTVIDRGQPAPAVVEFRGYGAGRGLAHERTLWSQAGFIHVVMDNRGQSGWSPGDTADSAGSGASAGPGFMTRGIHDPDDYYYRRLFVDAARCVEAVAGHDLVDRHRLAVTGGSQGGALAIAAAALGQVAAAAIDVPFLSDFGRALLITDSDPYDEIKRYLTVRRDDVDTVLSTLRYFDVSILGRRCSAPALFSVGLMDQITPPSTVYSAYNNYGAQTPQGRPSTAIREYRYNGHDGGGTHHDVVKIDWLTEVLGWPCRA